MKMSLVLSVLLIPSLGFASTKYKCSISADNMIGIGLESHIELLDDSTSANVTPFVVNIRGEKYMQISIENPGTFTKHDNVIHLSNIVRPLGHSEVSYPM